MPRRPPIAVTAVAAAVIALAGCGQASGPEAAPPTTDAPATSTAPAPPTSDTPAGSTVPTITAPPTTDAPAGSTVPASPTTAPAPATTEAPAGSTVPTITAPAARSGGAETRPTLLALAGADDLAGGAFDPDTVADSDVLLWFWAPW